MSAKISEWSDEDLESAYLNTLNFMARHEKDNPAKVRQAGDRIQLIEEEWERRRQLAAKGEYKPDRPEKGMLARLGYQVGNEGKDTKTRRMILARAVTGVLPPIPHPAYIDEWGAPGSETRLAKVANVISFLVRDKMKWNDDAYAKAIIEWQEDLNWLKQNYYLAGQYKFKWPT